MTRYSTAMALADPDNVEAITDTDFTPIPSLIRTDADTALVFLSQNVSYMSEVHDPWFRSTTPFTFNITEGDGRTYVNHRWSRDTPVNVIACAQQYQLRNSITGATSRLGGIEVVTHAQAQQLGFNDNQIAVFNRSFWIASYTLMDTTALELGGTSLLATAYQTDQESLGLPDNQWHFEFEHYFGAALYVIQLWSQQYVSGPLSPQMDQYVVPATEGFAKEMCTSQIVRRSDYRSFSVLGIIIIFAFGFLFAFINHTIRPIARQMQRHTSKGRYRNAEWQANDFLQLQRMAYQHNNMGTWKGQQDIVPLTNPGEVFTLPESAYWDQDVPNILEKGRDGLSRLGFWNRSQETENSEPLFGDRPGSSRGEKSTVSTAGAGRRVEVTETRVSQ